MRGVFALILAAVVTSASAAPVEGSAAFSAVAQTVGARFIPDPRQVPTIRHPDVWTSGRGRYTGNCQEFAYAVQREGQRKGLEVAIWFGINRNGGYAKPHVVPVLHEDGKPWVYADTRSDGSVVTHPFLEPERFEPMALVRFGDSLSPDYSQQSLPVIGWDTVENRVVLLQSR